GVVCDPDERCPGTSAACPDDVVQPAGTTCRATAGVCDVAETCSGTAGAACPADGFKSSTVVCRTGSGDPNGSGVVCDPDERCTGSSAACPADMVQPAGTTCRPTAGVCDVAETCSGTVGAPCPPNGFASASTSCTGASQGGACDNDG